MATRGAIAGIQADAIKRIDAATAGICDTLGIEPPPPAPFARQPPLQEAYELERQAALLESILTALGSRKATPSERQGNGNPERGSDASDAGRGDGEANQSRRGADRGQGRARREAE